jgi:hypothetical protein
MLASQGNHLGIGEYEMDDQEESNGKACNSSQTSELPEQAGKEVTANYRSTPPPPRHDQKIHPRQPIPPVPEGEEVADADPSPPVELE